MSYIRRLVEAFSVDQNLDWSKPRDDCIEGEIWKDLCIPSRINYIRRLHGGNLPGRLFDLEILIGPHLGRTWVVASCKISWRLHSSVIM